MKPRASTRPAPAPAPPPAKPVARGRRSPWSWALPILGGFAAFAAAAGLGWALWARGEPDRLRERAIRAYQAHEPVQVEAALARLVRFRDLTSDEWLLRGEMAQTRGLADQALKALAHIPDTDPRAAKARLREGQIERGRNRVRLAEAHYWHALELDPTLIQAHRELIFIFGMQLRRADLYARFRALGRLTELNFDDMFLWCLSRGLAWEPVEAVRILSKFVEADPDDRASRLALVDNLGRLDRLDEVARLLSALPESDPDALSRLAQAALDRGDIPGVEALLAKGSPDHPQLARLRGNLAMARRDWPAAIRNFRIALAADPQMRDALRGLGQALSATGDREGAAAPLEAARALDRVGALVSRAAMVDMRENVPLMRDLGDACRAAGLREEARGWYRLVISKDPLDSEAQRKLFLLESEAKSGTDEGRKPGAVPVAPQAPPR